MSSGAVKSMRSLRASQKAALLIVLMGEEAAAAVFRCLGQEDMEVLAREVAGLGDVPAEVRDKVLGEFEEMMLAHAYLTEGGMDVAKNLLYKALGPDRALEVLERVEDAAPTTSAFQRLNEVDERQLVKPSVALDDLVRDARQRSRHAIGVHHDRHGGTWVE